MADTAATQDWVNQPQQARSRETMNRFVLAVELLLREKPFDDITIGEIVDGAERTVGSFYARFEDKWALLRTVIHRYLEQIREFIDHLLNADEWSHPPSRRNGASDVACLSRAISGARAYIPGRTGILGYRRYCSKGAGSALLIHPTTHWTCSPRAP